LQREEVTVNGGTVAVIAPGTGLGEATLVDIGGRYHALPSEGGHADYAPGTDEEVELLRFLRKRYGGHVSYERVLSGAGIGDLYSFAREASGTSEPAWLAAKIAAGDRNAVISEAALAKTDECSVRALDLFAANLGAEAGNLALRTLATGGVVIGGGIPPKILPALQSGGLVERLNNKGRFSKWTRALGVRVALEPRAALLGAAHHVITTRDSR
jgi:glucokinase